MQAHDRSASQQVLLHQCRPRLAAALRRAATKRRQQHCCTVAPSATVRPPRRAGPCLRRVIKTAHSACAQWSTGCCVHQGEDGSSTNP
jgi:hypothetical protein